MSDPVVIDAPDIFTERAVPLLKEYLEKLLNLRRRIRAIRKTAEAPEKYGSDTRRILTAEYSALEQYYKRLQPAIRAFNQQVSGMIDQGSVTPLMKVELQLRLAELESVVQQMPLLFTAYKPR